jgi:hypothetical protein
MNLTTWVLKKIEVVILSEAFYSGVEGTAFGSLTSSTDF